MNSKVCWMGLWDLDVTKTNMLVKNKAVEVIPPISRLFPREKDIDEHYLLSYFLSLTKFLTTDRQTVEHCVFFNEIST